MPNEPCVEHEAIDVCFGEASDRSDISIEKRATVVLAFGQNRRPTETSLCAVESQKLEADAVKRFDCSRTPLQHRFRRAHCSIRMRVAFRIWRLPLTVPRVHLRS